MSLFSLCLSLNKYKQSNYNIYKEMEEKSYTDFNKSFIRKIFNGDPNDEVHFPKSTIPEPDEIVEYYSPDKLVGINKFDIELTIEEKEISGISRSNNIIKYSNVYNLSQILDDIQHFGFTFKVECKSHNIDDIHLVHTYNSIKGITNKINDMDSHKWLDNSYLDKQFEKYTTIGNYVNLKDIYIDQDNPFYIGINNDINPPEKLILTFHNYQIYRIENMFGILNNIRYNFSF